MKKHIRGTEHDFIVPETDPYEHRCKLGRGHRASPASVAQKSTKWIPCVLWAIVGVRLILPFSVESAFSLLPTSEPITDEVMESAEQVTEVSQKTESSQTVSKEQGDISFIGEAEGENDLSSREETKEPSERSVPESEQSVTPPIIVGTESDLPSDPFAGDVKKRVLSLSAVIWLLGIAGMAIYAAYSYLRIYTKVRSSISVSDRAYINDEIETPFILGVFRPRIYLPSALTEEEQQHVLAHERAHLARLDHLWKLTEVPLEEISGCDTFKVDNTYVF